MRAIKGSMLAMGLSLLAAAAAAQTDPRADETFGHPEGAREPGMAQEHRDQRVSDPLQHELHALRSDIEYERGRVSSREHGKLDELRQRVDRFESGMKADMSREEKRAMRKELGDIRAELDEIRPASGRERPDGARNP